MTDTHWKLVWVAVAGLLYAGAAYIPSAAGQLHALAGFAAGSVLVPAPGHGRASTPDSVRPMRADRHDT